MITLILRLLLQWSIRLQRHRLNSNVSFKILAL